VLGGVLLTASIAAELIHPVQRSDGTTTDPFLHALYLAAWLAGCLLVALAVLGLGSMLRANGATRAGTIGMWLSVAGIVCFALSAIGGLAGVFTGSYLEGAFVLLLVGFPLLIVGNLSMSAAARSSSVPRGTWLLLGVAAIGLLVALLAEADPFHDIGFFVFFGSWIVLGINLWLSAGVRAPTGATE
jgi:hypothetical protein